MIYMCGLFKCYCKIIDKFDEKLLLQNIRHVSLNYSLWQYLPAGEIRLKIGFGLATPEVSRNRKTDRQHLDKIPFFMLIAYITYALS